ncbi:hypothetical protein FOMPIDRAFT_1050728 [Fomitopsis schrenkii]|uniref:Uncharacterized protein n=1 Tax=Fomitopsis schrenkii TaxID=2126942 RepID=S8E7C9_FOMSC|nr:hypothetical protein FOMPIDRAFT_1050728 [Fomitopsis schrenkii]
MTADVPSVALANLPDWEPALKQVAAQHLAGGGPRSKKSGSSSFNIPNEVLVDIIGLVVASLYPDHSGASRWMVKIAAVCSRWRSVLICAPLLWRTIDLAGCEDFLRLCLARSADVRIHLVLTAGRVHRNVTKDILVSMLTPHFLRISDVRLSFSDVMDPLPLMFLISGMSGLPNLESLCLSMDDVLVHPPVFKITSPPRQASLRHLSLSKMFVMWPTTTLSQLTSLELSNAPFYRLRFSQDILLNILSEASNSLESFTFNGSDLHPPEEATDLLVALPKMQCFRLCAPAVDVAPILARISLPPANRLEVKTLGREEDPGPDLEVGYEKPMFSEFLPLYNRQLLPILNDARCVMVWSQPTVAMVYADSERTVFWQTQPWRSHGYSWPASASGFSSSGSCTAPSLCLSYDLTEEAEGEWQLARVIKDLSRCFPPTVETLVLRATMYPALHERDAWLSMLSSFPNLRELDIIADDCDVELFLVFLGPTPSGTPCAHLQHLSLRVDLSSPVGTDTMIQLTETLEAREREGCHLSRLTLWLQHVDPDLAFAPIAFATQLKVSRLPHGYENFQTNLEALVDVFTVEVGKEPPTISDDTDEDNWDEEDSGEGDSDEEESISERPSRDTLDWTWDFMIR